ncbi:MAG: hypothetical protein K0Q95_3222 [Bacteroidota bacterium]|jgi:hypothetical protein|nr:hypothetical protein [Bacteroidota bacterium]
MKKLLFCVLLALSINAKADCTGLTVNFYMNPATCFGTCNGHGYVTASGGSGNYSYSFRSSTYSVLPNQVNDSVYNLCAGSYYVIVNDITNGCLDTNAFNITSPPSMATITNGNATMCAGTSVNLVSTTSGGTPGYTYSWSPATGLASVNGPSTIASPASTTNYVITVTDANGCISTASSLITVNPNPIVTVNSSTICQGATAILTASGAATYTWSAGATSTGANTAMVNPNSTTSYTVTGTAGGCTSTAVSTVTVNPNPIVTASSNQSVCGACNGTAFATSSIGGSAYSWSGPNGFSASGQTIPSLCPGTYQVVAVFMGCVSSPATTVVSTGSGISTAISNLVPASCGACNGSATVNVTGGNGPYSYLWAPGGLTTPTATNLCAGNYTVTVTDNSGCTASTLVSIPNSTTISGTLSSTATGCGLCNGSANVTVSGGASPYTYMWSPAPGSGQGTAAISGLCAGTYTVMVTDANGCTFYGNTTVNNTNQVYATASSTAASCGMCNGTATAFATGGVGSYLYSINGSAQQTNGNFAGLCAGAYTITATDANGCSGNYVVTIPSANSASLTVSANIQNESAAGLHNGSINLTVAGSTGPYTYVWSNGATTEDIFSLVGGSYTVVVTDTAGNCGSYSFQVYTTNSYGWISGYAYNDNNANCVYDAGDTPLSNHWFTATDGINTYSAVSSTYGSYSMMLPAGNYTISPITTNYLEASCNSSINVTVANYGSVNGNNFAYVHPPYYDVCVNAYANGMVPGFNGFYNITVNNYGNQSPSGEVYIVLPSVTTYLSASPTPSHISGDTIFWNYNIPGGASYFYASVSFHTSSSAVLGTSQVAYINASVTNGTDVNPVCNSYAYSRIVTGSFDPNEKSVSPSGSGFSGDIPLSVDEFTYLIQFQNTGSGPAVNITVDDTLSSQLDLSSIEMVYASHNHVLQMISPNVIRWQFDSIMLADSNTNEAASHGYIQFKIRKLNSPMAGEVIQNKAYIYFDFNAPVITNTAINTYNVAASVGETSSNRRISVYPNPFNDQTTFVINGTDLNGHCSFVMTDVLGKVVREITTADKQFTVSREGLNNGMYFYSIMTRDGLLANGKLIIK